MANLTWADIRRKLSEFGAEYGEWAGCPMPIEGIKLVIEPRFQFGHLNGAKLPSDLDEADTARNISATGEVFDFGPDGTGEIFIINMWYSRRHDADVYVYHTGDGRSKVGIHWQTGQRSKVDFLIHMMTPVYAGAWSLEMEERAVATLGTLIKPHALEYYKITGCFMESSARSGLTYMFRRGRPTIVLRPTKDGAVEGMVALCLHPIGYYKQTFCGVMCPTDDVIAHLMLMRGDEWLYWKSANQIPLDQPNSGL